MMVISRALQNSSQYNLTLNNTQICNTYARNTEEHRDNMMINVCNVVRDASGSTTDFSCFVAVGVGSPTLLVEPLIASSADPDEVVPGARSSVCPSIVVPLSAPGPATAWASASLRIRVSIIRSLDGYELL